MKKLRKHLKIDLPILNKWLKANKISLNASKTEYLIFRNPKKMINFDLKLKLDGHKLIPSKYVKYLGVLIDPLLNWSYHVNLLAPKLSRAIGMLSKIRHYVDQYVLRDIYFAIFSSLMCYGAQAWAQVDNQHIKRITKLQDKAIKVINFEPYEDPPSSYYKKSSLLKFQDTIRIQNFIFVHDNINRRLPYPLLNQFEYIKENSPHDTRIAKKLCVKLQKCRTINYGLKSICGNASRSFNSLQVHLEKDQLHTKSRNICKNVITSYIIDTYE